MNYFLIILLIFLDQCSKWIIQSRFSVHESIPIVKNIFHITYVQNVGAAFGILKNQKMFFIIATVFIVSSIFIYIYKQKNLHKILTGSLSLVIAGAIGNFIDRIRFGYVVDFFDFRIWPVFNIADMCIVFGAIGLCYYMIFLENRS
ncbi:signal peptidase II [Inediibacterium massiliense]|uniref:signal peptidase II n=1 Tax=Inediibacterium massiliense TaxID=1658111 RepID=UPI0006B5FA55|nr:signal peptidase II [Inediibacterium massiliense]